MAGVGASVNQRLRLNPLGLIIRLSKITRWALFEKAFHKA